MRWLVKCCVPGLGALVLSLVTAAVTFAGPATSDTTMVDAWASGKQWLSVRAGYAKVSYGQAPDGLYGYGFGFNRMLNKRWSLGAYIHHEALGRFGSATEIEVPVTAELVRHFRWNTALRPYFGIGGGVFMKKFYRSGDDGAVSRSGFYFDGGFNTPLDAHHILGLDVRSAIVNGQRNKINPVFGQLGAQETQWSIKLNWALVY